MSVVMECGIRVSADDKGIVTVEARGEDNEYRRVMSYTGVQETQLAEYLECVWEADTEAENAAFSSMISGIKQGTSNWRDDQTLYRSKVTRLMTERGIPEACQASLLAIVNEAKGMSNSDGFWNEPDSLRL